MDVWRYIVAGVSGLTMVGVAIASKEAPGSPAVELVLGPHHILFAVLAILVVLSLGGKNLAEFIRGLTKKGGDVNVNLDKDWRHSGVLVNPDLCKVCQAEHERSLQNQANIVKLDEKVDRLKECFDAGFKQISQEIGETKTEIVKALAANRR